MPTEYLGADLREIADGLALVRDEEHLDLVQPRDRLGSDVIGMPTTDSDEMDSHTFL